MKEFDEIVENIRNANGLTKKTTEKLFVDLISNKKIFNQFQDALNLIKTNFSICETCFYIKNNNKCDFCDDSSRNKNIICVVSSILDAKNIDKNSKFHGLFAILSGEINLTKSISPDKLNIEKIFERVNKDTELVLALNATFEGEVTSNYIAQLAKQKNIKISRIAKGIPMGGMLDYMDEKTLQSAFENRNKEGGK